MIENEISKGSERLVTLLENIRGLAQTVYDETEQLIDALPKEFRNPVVDPLVNGAYDQLLRADKLIQLGRSLLVVKPYPRYEVDETYWRELEKRSDEQRQRLDHHLRDTCLRDGHQLQSRKDAAQAVIDGMLDVYESRDVLFYLLERRSLTDGTRRMADGIIELSLDYIETITGVVRPLTRIQPAEPALSR